MKFAFDRIAIGINAKLRKRKGAKYTVTLDAVLKYYSLLRLCSLPTLR